MTLKQKAFCDYYIASLNATEAAIKAGYSKKTAKEIGSINLTKINIKNYIEERLKQMEDKRIADATEVLQMLTKGARMELEEEVVVTEGVGDGCSEARIITKKISAKDAVKCAELLGKRYALFSDKVNIDGAIPVIIAGEDALEE